MASQIYKLKTHKVNRKYVKIYVYFHIVGWSKVSVDKAKLKVQKNKFEELKEINAFCDWYRCRTSVNWVSKQSVYYSKTLYAGFI